MKTTIECEEFYNLMQNYRHAKSNYFYEHKVIDAYQDVIDYIDENLNTQPSPDITDVEMPVSQKPYAYVIQDGVDGDYTLAYAAFYHKYGNPLPEVAQPLYTAPPVSQEPYGWVGYLGSENLLKGAINHFRNRASKIAVPLYTAPPDYEALCAENAALKRDIENLKTMNEVNDEISEALRAENVLLKEELNTWKFSYEALKLQVT